MQKMIKNIILILPMIMVTVVISAQSKKEEAVTGAVTLLKQAMIDGDSVMLDKLTSANLLYGHSGGQIQDKPAFIHSFTSGSSDFVSIDLAEQTITISGNTAIVRHKLSATTNDNGKPGTVNLIVMTVWQKQHKDWKMIARQAVRPPQ